MSVEKVYESVAAAGLPVTFSGPWKGLPCDPSFFRLPSDLTALLNNLQAQFDEKVLIESGVACLDGRGAVEINPVLKSADLIVWALRRQSDAPPFQLVANQSSVRRSMWSFSSVFADGRTAKMIEDVADRVAVAFTMTDLAILWSLKIPAVPAAGLSRRSGNRLEVFCKSMNISRKPDEQFSTFASADKTSTTVGQPRVLLLCDWSVELLGKNDSLQAQQLWKYLGDLQKYLGLDLYDFQRLKPTPEEFAKLRFIMDHGRWEDVREAVLDGPYAESESLYVDKSLHRPTPDSLSVALGKWRRTQRHSKSDVTAQKAAWNDVLTVQDRQLFDPLTEEAERAKDPTERNLLTALTGMSRLLHPQMLMMAEKLGQAIGEKGTNALNAISKDDFQQVIAVADRVMALTQGIQACRQKKPFQMIATPRPKPAKTCSKESGSTTKKSPR